MSDVSVENKSVKKGPARIPAWKTILGRELKSYFTSPVAYIVCALFLIASGLLFFSIFFAYGRAELRAFFEWLPILFSFFIPALTMRIFSEEKRSGSFETLVTLPVDTKDIVWGKYLASFISGIVLLVPTLCYVVACLIFGKPDAGPMIGGYLGAMLLVAAYTSIGLFASSVTRNQIVAFFLSGSICIALTMIDTFSILIPGGLVPVLSFLSARSHFMSVSRGIIDSRDIIYFASLTALFFALTVRVLKNDRRG